MKTQAEILNENVIELDGRVTQLDQKVDALGGSVNSAISAVANQANAKVEAMGEAMNTAISTVIEKTDSLAQGLSATVDRIREIDENVAGMNQGGTALTEDILYTLSGYVPNKAAANVKNTMTAWNLDKVYALLSELSSMMISNLISSYTSSDISSNISTDISSNYETILSVCYDTIDQFYAENNISDFVTYDEISAEVFEYEQANGEIDVDLSSDTRGTNIANTIRDGFIQGQSDMGMIEYRATKLIPSDVLKIKSGIERDSPDISKFLTDDDCDPTNLYITHCDQFFDLYNSIIDRLINDAQDENKIIELFGYVAGLNNTNGDLTNAIKNYVKYFKIHENDIDVVLNDIKSTTSININRVILKDVIPENTRDASTATRSAAEIANSLREYTAGQWNKPLMYTNYGEIARTSEEIRDIINSYENTKASNLTNFQLQNVRSCKAALEALRLQTKYFVQGSAYASRQAVYKAFLDCKNLVRVVEPLTRSTVQTVGPRLKDIGMIIFGLLMYGIKALWAFLLSPTGLVVIGIIIILLLLYLIFKDRRGFNRPIDLSKDLVKNILNASKKLNGYATSVSDPFVDNVKKDLGHHTQYIEVTVNDGYNSITKNINTAFLSEDINDLQDEVDNLIKTDYKITEINKDKYHGTFYGSYIEMFECIGESISEVVDQCIDLLLGNNNTIEIDAYPAMEGDETCPICGKPLGDEDDDHCTGYEAHDIQWELAAEFHGPIKLWIDYENQVEYEGPGKEIENAVGWALANAYTIVDGEKVYLPEYDKWGPVNGLEIPFEEWNLDPNSLKTVTLPSVTELTTTSGGLTITIHISGWKKCGSNNSVIEPGAKYTLSDDEVHEYIKGEHDDECINCESQGVLNFEIVGSVDID